MDDKVKPETARRFGAMLRQAREARGLSQAGLGERLGIGQAQVSNVESGTNVRLSTLENFARYLGYELVLVPRDRVRDVAAVSAAPTFTPSLPRTRLHDITAPPHLRAPPTGLRNVKVRPSDVSALQAITGEPTVAREASELLPAGGRALPFDMPRGEALDALHARPLFATGGVVDDDSGEDN